MTTVAPMRRSKKATEKPIEIFIALFIILAVSLLVLRLFQGQISQATEELGQAQLEQETQATYNSFQQGCSDACTAAASRGCTQEALVQLCISNSRSILGARANSMDLDNNQEIGYNTQTYGGVGVCEQHIPCFMEQPQCCNRRINLQTCIDILCDYWTGQGFDSETHPDRFDAVGFSMDSFNVCNANPADPLAFWNTIDGGVAYLQAC